jgi:polysaccharide biosynthesis transport protein
LKDKSVDYATMRDQATQSRTLYNDLVKKLSENGVLKGLKPSDLSVVDPARIPAAPSKPNTLLFIAVAIALGLLFGFGGMLLAEGLDGSVHTTGQIAQMGIPLIGILPKYGDETSVGTISGLRTLSAPQSAYSEALRSVRSSLVATGAGGNNRVILVTSPNGDEGNSLTARNLAVSLAQQGKRVVLMDANFRGGGEEGGREFSAKDGLSTLLSGPPAPPALLQVPSVPNLFVLPSGALPKNPAELLSSPRMKMLVDEFRQQFEVVIVDSPPVLPVVDSLLLAELADSVLLVAKSEVTDEESLRRAFQLLSSRTKQPDSVAVVLNGVSTKSDIYRSYFGTSTAHYYQENAHETA